MQHLHFMEKQLPTAKFQNEVYTSQLRKQQLLMHVSKLKPQIPTCLIFLIFL